MEGLSFTSHDIKDTPDPGYDWAAFVGAYASGKWDPHKTPHPPRSQFQPPTHFRNSLSESLSEASLKSVSEISPPEPVVPREPLIDLSKRPSELQVAAATISIQPPSPLPTKAGRPTEIRTPKTDRSQSLNISSFSNRLRNSFADLRSSTLSESDASTSPLTADIIATAATIRWAAAGVSVAPLALPSPEHELTDPMRGVNAPIPGSHPPELTPEGEKAPMSPGRRTRLASFWEGTQYLDRVLPTVQGSPDLTPETESFEEQAENSSPDMASASMFVTPATAPLNHAGDSSSDDYFGDVGSSSRGSILTSRDHPPLARHESFDLETSLTAPAVPRRIALARQTSSPLPSISVYDRPFRAARATRSSSESSMIAPTRAVKEEQVFAELGYLVPPNPPDELERRRALYRHVQISHSSACYHLL